MHSAIKVCSALEARVCTHADMQELCGNGMNPFKGDVTGWYGTHGTANNGNWDDEYGTWNRDHCDKNNDGPPEHSGAKKAFRCCMSGALTNQATAVCPPDLAAMSTRNGEICISGLKAKKNMHEAIDDCRSLKGHVCLHNEMQQLCGTKKNPYQGATQGWYGDHGKAHNGNWDDEYGTWNRNHCTPNNDGPAYHADRKYNYRCCATSGAVKVAITMPKKCDDGFSKFGGLCLRDPRVKKNMFDAIQTCRGFKAHVCQHIEMQTICGYGENPYKNPDNSAGGWYGDHGMASGGNWDDEYGTWNNAVCKGNNDGPPKHAGEQLYFRCCKGASIPSPAKAPAIAEAIVEAPTGFQCTDDSSLCYATKSGATDMHSAIKVCSALEARVCTHADMQELCGNGMNPFKGDVTGWYGTHGTANNGNWDDEYGTWNRDHCDKNNDGPPEHSGAKKAFRCCMSGALTNQATAVCPPDLAAMSTRNGEICISGLKAKKNMHEAIDDCRSLKGHVCLHNDMQQLCGTKKNPYQGASQGWYGDHGKASGGNWDDEYGTWNRDHCDPNNDGPPHHAHHKFHYRCCATSGAVKVAGTTIPKECDDGFSKFGGLCYRDPKVKKNMFDAIQTCQGFKAHVCQHVEMQTVCAHGENPYPNPGNAGGGWYGDHGMAGGGNWDDEYGTWNNAHCAGNNDGPPKHANENLYFRCCKRALVPPP